MRQNNYVMMQMYIILGHMHTTARQNNGWASGIRCDRQGAVNQPLIWSKIDKRFKAINESNKLQSCLLTDWNLLTYKSFIEVVAYLFCW